MLDGPLCRRRGAGALAAQASTSAFCPWQSQRSVRRGPRPENSGPQLRNTATSPRFHPCSEDKGLATILKFESPNAQNLYSLQLFDSGCCSVVLRPLSTDIHGQAALRVRDSALILDLGCPPRMRNIRLNIFTSTSKRKINKAKH